MAEEKLSTSNFYDLTFECKSLVDRLTNEEKSVSGLRRELLTEHEFQEKLFDDSVKDKDWAYVRFISDYFLRLMEAPINPLSLSLGERTTASYTIQPIFNHILLNYAYLFNIKWIEVNNDYTETTKLGGLGFAKGLKELLLIIEFAGGNISKLNS